MIRCTGVRHRRLAIPSLAANARQIAVIGPNGAGKTTFLGLCAGMEEPEAGEVTLFGRRPSEVRIGWVGEFPDRTMLFSRVYDEIASSLRFRHVSARESDARVHETAALLGIEGLLPKATDELSGGEKALVAFAAALVHDPEILILDEVDSHLDEEAGRRVADAIRSRPGISVIACTQHMDTAAEADLLLYIEEGCIRHAGTAEEVFDRLKETCFYPAVWRVRGC